MQRARRVKHVTLFFIWLAKAGSVMGATDLDATIERTLNRKLGVESSQTVNGRFGTQKLTINEEFCSQEQTITNRLDTKLQEMTRCIIESISGEDTVEKKLQGRAAKVAARHSPLFQK
jgi:hypothetical protein